MDEIKDLFSELIKDDYYKNELKRVIFEKIKDKIEYSYQNVFDEVINEFFSTEIKTELIKEFDNIKSNLFESVKAKFKSGIEELSDMIKIKPSSWDLEKTVKGWIKIEDKNNE